MAARPSSLSSPTLPSSPSPATAQRGALGAPRHVYSHPARARRTNPVAVPEEQREWVPGVQSG